MNVRGTEYGQAAPVRSRGGWRQARPCPTLDARVPARASASLRPRPAPLAPAVSRTTPPARKDRLRDGPHLPQMAPCRNNGNMVCVRTTTDKIVRARSRPPAFRPALRRPLPKQLPVRYRHRLRVAGRSLCVAGRSGHPHPVPRNGWTSRRRVQPGRRARRARVRTLGSDRWCVPHPMRAACAPPRPDPTHRQRRDTAANPGI